MLIQYASSGRPPIIVNFVDFVTIRNDRINIIHSDEQIETEKIIEDGCVLMLKQEEEMLISIKVVRKNGHVRTVHPCKDKVCIKIDGDKVTINGATYEDSFSVFIEEIFD